MTKQRTWLKEHIDEDMCGGEYLEWFTGGYDVSEILPEIEGWQPDKIGDEWVEWEFGHPVYGFWRISILRSEYEIRKEVFR